MGSGWNFCLKSSMNQPSINQQGRQKHVTKTIDVWGYIYRTRKWSISLTLPKHSKNIQQCFREKTIIMKSLCYDHPFLGSQIGNDWNSPNHHGGCCWQPRDQPQSVWKICSLRFLEEPWLGCVYWICIWGVFSEVVVFFRNLYVYI